MIARRLSFSMWLALGVALAVLSVNRWGIPALVWVAPVPWLVAAARAEGAKQWGALVLALTIAQVAAVAKIITPPMPYAIALVFGAPMAMGTAVAAVLWRLARRWAGPVAAVAGWAALTALTDWAGYAHSELSAWTTSTNGLAPDLLWMQLTAWGGLGLLGAVVAGTSAMIATVLLDEDPWRHRRPAAANVALLVALALAAAVRLDRLTDLGPTVRVAAVTTQVGLGPDGPPTGQAARDNTDGLFVRSERAVARGAQVVVWNEAATLIPPSDEAELLKRGDAFATSHGVDLVLAYGVTVSTTPLLFRNEYAWFGAEGGEVQRYAKHHPVPGEPSVRGEGPLEVRVRPYGTAAGAICYDLDFPAIARTFAQQGAGLLLVPASDWRGIDPLHTQMAAVRAIETGASVLRSVRAAASAGFDAAGRPRGWMSADSDDGVLVVDLPITPVPTWYTRFGDTPVLVASVAVLLAVLARAGVAARRGMR